MHHKNCQRWLKEGQDKKKPKDVPSRGHRKGQGRKVSYPQEIEEQLVKWILEKREECHIPVSTMMIRLKASSLVKPIMPDFKASEGWVRKFLARNNLVLRARTSIAQTLPSDLEEKVARFHQNVTYIRTNADFPYELIANMDETPAYFDMVSSKTIDRKGKKSISVRTTKSEKRHVTVVLTCVATGKMLPPMVIFKGKTSRTICGVSNKSKSIITYQEKAWMDETRMKEWIGKVWAAYTKKKPALLILDSFSAHLTDAVQELFRRYNTTVIVIPGRCTSVLQPLDVSINKPFKQHLKRSWEQYMLQQSETMNESQSDGKIKPPTKQLLVDWIEANGRIDFNTTIAKKSFLVTGISNALGGDENHLAEVFGDEHMGFIPSDNHSPDPFASSDSDEEEQGGADEIKFEEEPQDATESEIDSDYSVIAPEFEELTSDTADSAH